MKKSRILVSLTLAMLAVPLVPASFGALSDAWTWRNPSPTGNTLTAIAHGATEQFAHFVAVDNAGSIYESTDGLNWNQEFVGTNALTAVCFGNGLFVAVGGTASGGGVVLVSQDGGLTWPQNYSVKNFLNAVAYGTNEFVAIGNGAATASGDATGWTDQNNSSVPAGINGIAWGAAPAEFVAVGNGGGVHYSPDGTNWTAATSGTPYQLNSVAYGTGTFQVDGGYGHFVAVGESIIITSLTASDVSEWTTVSTTDFGTAVTYGGTNMFLSMDIDHRPGTFVSTNNGYAFTDANSSFPPPYADGVTYGDGAFVAVGSAGQTAVSMDASNWTLSATPPTTQPLTSGAFRPDTITYGPNLFVVGGGSLGGSGVILTSPDGLHWTLDTSASVTGYQGTLGSTVPSGFVYVNGQFVGVGTDYNGFENGVSLLSTDGIVWTSYNAISNHSLSAIAYGIVNGVGTYVAVGSSGTVPYSTDGSTWTSNGLATTFVPTLNSVIYANFANNNFFAVGGSGLSAVSPDGVHWNTNNYAFVNTTLYAVAFGNRLLVAVGGESYITNDFFTSYDGLNWNLQRQSSTVYPALSSVIYAGGVFVAAGGGGDIFVSPDGTNWNTRDVSGTLNNLSCLLYGDGQILALGASGTILGNTLSPSPPPFASPAYSPATGFSFTINGAVGPTLFVEFSTDLKNWTLLQTYPGGGTVQFTDPSLSSSKYYRFGYLP